MKYIYTQEFYKTQNVKFEYYDNRNTFHSIPMEYDRPERHWFCNCEEDVIRYKFVVNDIIRLNDPNAGCYVEDENGEVWSAPGECVERKPRFAIYNISNNMQCGVAKAIKQASYMFNRPLDIYIGAGVRYVKGLHSVTLICFQPNGRIYRLEERSIGQFEPREADYEIVFHNHIPSACGRNADGVWTYQIYVDGKCVVKDYFALKRKVVQVTFY